MICPVCKQKIGTDAAECPYCGFDKLVKEFVNKDDYNEWMEQVVIPYRNTYLKMLSVAATNIREESPIFAMHSEMIRKWLIDTCVRIEYKEDLSYNLRDITTYDFTFNNDQVEVNYSHTEDQKDNDVTRTEYGVFARIENANVFLKKLFADYSIHRWKYDMPRLIADDGASWGIKIWFKYPITKYFLCEDTSWWIHSGNDRMVSYIHKPNSDGRHDFYIEYWGQFFDPEYCVINEIFNQYVHKKPTELEVWIDENLPW